MIFRISTPRMELWRIDGPFSNDPHQHEDEYQITVPMYGTFRFTQENRDYQLAAGGGLVQHPRERHVFEIEGEAGVLIFKVRQESLREFARRDSLELDLRQHFDPALLAGRFRQWVRRLLAYDPVDPLAQEEAESTVMSYLCDALSGNHRIAGAAGSGRRAAASGSGGFLAQVADYIHAHYTDPVSIDELAAIAMQSRYHFIRTFKAAFGVTPYQYVLRLRIDEAKRLLRRSGRSVTDIGVSLGFSGGSAFYRAFLKTVGDTPEHYRQAGGD